MQGRSDGVSRVNGPIAKEGPPKEKIYTRYYTAPHVISTHLISTRHFENSIIHKRISQEQGRQL
jgi:hypothetical protein